jgi:hypothetical protein
MFGAPHQVLPPIQGGGTGNGNRKLFAQGFEGLVRSPVMLPRIANSGGDPLESE